MPRFMIAWGALEEWLAERLARDEAMIAS